MQNNNKRLNIIERITALDQQVVTISGQLRSSQDLNEKLLLQQQIDATMLAVSQLHISLAALDQAEIEKIQERIQGTTRFKRT